MGASMIFEIAAWIFIASIFVYVVMNAQRVAVAVGALGNWSTSEEALLVGS